MAYVCAEVCERTPGIDAFAERVSVTHVPAMRRALVKGGCRARVCPGRLVGYIAESVCASDRLKEFVLGKTVAGCGYDYDGFSILKMPTTIRMMPGCAVAGGKDA